MTLDSLLKLQLQRYPNKCIRDDTKAAACRSPKFSKKTKKRSSIWQPCAILNVKGLITGSFKSPCRNPRKQIRSFLVIFGTFVTVITFGTPVALWYTRDRITV